MATCVTCGKPRKNIFFAAPTRRREGEEEVEESRPKSRRQTKKTTTSAPDFVLNDDALHDTLRKKKAQDAALAATRKNKQKEYDAVRRGPQETAAHRKKRLLRMKEYNAARASDETEEQRNERLLSMKKYNAERASGETVARRKARPANKNVNEAARRGAEDATLLPVNIKRRLPEVITAERKAERKAMAQHVAERMTQQKAQLAVARATAIGGVPIPTLNYMGNDMPAINCVHLDRGELSYYKCPLCPYTHEGGLFKDFYRHLNGHLTKLLVTYPLQCLFCDDPMKSMTGFISHLRTHHVNTGAMVHEWRRAANVQSDRGSKLKSDDFITYWILVSYQKITKELGRDSELPINFSLNVETFRVNEKKTPWDRCEERGDKKTRYIESFIQFYRATQAAKGVVPVYALDNWGEDVGTDAIDLLLNMNDMAGGDIDDDELNFMLSEDSLRMRLWSREES
jgi:hypothetical protein